ncbi:related to GTP-binding protein OBG [Cephalotrichum gorgonifer]|uniref:Related to GTP-binding protein OBG n=1 Tax=Cephalotrichum gorgonifer TaxID=2041049 RepID=A0AAE8N6X6_9PEZI|nr:related to GTP-binding protein OBG [Cephalotrichum gorgonifer]
MSFRAPARPALRVAWIPNARRQSALQACPFSIWSCRSAPDTPPAPPNPIDDIPRSRLNPAPDDYAAANFADKARLAIYAGPGGNGCIAFLREAYFPNGPANGGDGGHGGNVYIQAVPGETSLHKISRRRFVRAGKGTNGRGNAQAGQKGTDVIITVPVGTVVREVSREDPVAEAAAVARIRYQQRKLRRREVLAEGGEEALAEEKRRELAESNPDKDKWVLYPGLSKSEARNLDFPRLPRRERLFAQPPPGIHLDLRRPTPRPILLAAGGIGGLGNPHFVSRDHPRPLFATRGEESMTLHVELELKLLADVGLVGLPNAGKSTLLRALTNSRTRVGNWAFTTLQPNIGTVVLDKYSGRPAVKSFVKLPAAPELGMPEEEVAVEPRTRFTVADIPGLIEGAHLDRGLGIAFLRHVERARVLAFVIDLSAGNAVDALKSLWREVALYAEMRGEEERAREVEANIDWSLTSSGEEAPPPPQLPDFLSNGAGFSPQPSEDARSVIISKPWFVVATKADLPGTQENYQELAKYVADVQSGEVPHPTGVEGAWKEKCAVIPVSAIRGHNVEGIVHWTVGLLDED